MLSQQSAPGMTPEVQTPAPAPTPNQPNLESGFGGIYRSKAVQLAGLSWAIYGSLKNQHYATDNYAIHTFMDRVIDDLDLLDVIDTLQEEFMLGYGEMPIDRMEINNIASQFIQTEFSQVLALIESVYSFVCDYISILNEDKLNQGPINVLAGYADQLKHDAGLMKKFNKL